MNPLARFISFLSAAVLALMVACGGSSSTPVPVPEPTISSFSANRTTIAQNESAILTAVYTNGTGSVSPGPGSDPRPVSIPSGQPFTVSPQVTTTYVLTVTNAAGSTAARTLPINVIPPITGVSFTASKTSIAVGESVALTATFSSGAGAVTNSVNATSITPVSGVPFLVSPAVTTTYTLTVTNAAGASVTQGLIIVVQGAPAIASFTANPALISQGATSTLNYSFSGGSGFINNGVGPVFPGLTSAVSPAVTTTYLLTVTNATGNTAVSGVTVTVTGFPANLSLIADRSTITIGDSVHLTASFSSGSGVITNTLDGTTINPITGVPVTVTPASTVSYILTVTNAAGGSATAVATVTVVLKPVITSFAASPSTITSGNSANLTPVFTNGMGSINNGLGTVQTGVPVKVSPVQTTSYLLTVTNSAGAFVQISTTIKVVDAPTGISLVAIPPIITIGNSTRLIGTFSSGTAIVDNAVGPVLNGVPYLVTPPVTTTYTMTVTNAAGASATTGTVVTVVPPPDIISFLSNPATPPPVAGGSPVQLLPTFANGSGFIGGVGSVITGNSYTVNPLETTTYTLTVTNPAGDFVTRILTVHVVGDPVIDSFIAFPSTITAGDYSQLIGIFSGGNGVITAPPSGSFPPFPGAGIPVTSGVSLFVNPTATTTYTLTVTNAALVSVNRSVTILVVGLPTATSLTSSVNPITAGDTTMLTPTFAGGTGVVSPSVGPVLSGSAYAVQPTQTTTYTLTVTNSIGATTGIVHTVVVLTGPNAAALAAAPQGITLGGSAYLTAYFTIGTGGTASVVGTGPNAATSGLPAAINPLNAVPFPVTPTATGTYVYTLTVTNSAGVTSTHGATVTVYGVPTAALAITAGSNNPITIGETTSITPTFTNGTGVISGIGTVTSAQAYPVSPATTTTYVLTVTNPVGATATASLTVTVLAGPFASAFYFQPNIITEGDSTQLYAIFNNTTTEDITSNAAGFVAPSAFPDPTVISGTPQTVTAAAVSAGIYTYTLTVANAALTTYTTTTNLTVVPAPTAALNVAVPALGPPYTITAGQSATLNPVFTNGTGSINNGLGPVVSAASYVVTPLVSTTYTLTVTNAAGLQVTDSETIFVIAGPFSQALVSDRLVATSGDTLYLTALFNIPLPAPPANAAVTSSVGTDTGLLATPALLTGVPFAVALDGTDNSDRIFTLTADNGAGVTHTTGVLVKIVAAPTLVALAASSNNITVGETVTLTPTWTGGPDCVGILSGGGMTLTAVNGVGYSVNPVVTTTYVLTVTNGAGTSASDSQTITVVQPPSISQFTAVPAIITVGDSTQLFATFSNATVGPNVVNPGAMAITSGTPLTVTPAATTVYVLTVVGTGGTASANTTVRVVDAPICIITAEASPLIATTTGHFASVPNQSGSTYSWTITNGIITAGQGTSQITYTVGATTGVGAFGLGVTVVNAASASCNSTTTRDVNPVPALTVPTLVSNDADDTITAGSSVDLTPTFGGGVNPTGTITPAIGTVLSGVAYTVAPTITTTYNLVVRDSLGQTATASLTITVIQPVSITSFTASKNPVTIGAVTNLTAVFSNSTPAVNGNEITHGDALGNPASPIVPSSGSAIPYIPGTVGTQTHTLTETNLAGQTVTRTLPLVVVAAPVATNLVAVPATITAGTSSTLTPTFSDGTGVVNNGVGTVINAAGYPVTPLATTTYTLTVTNTAGDTAITQATVTVVSGPNAISLAASRRIITVNDSINLTALFINGTAVGGLTGSANSFTGAQLPATPTSGVPVLVTPTAAAAGTTVTYSLLVTNTAGSTDLETVSVDVLLAPTAALNQVGGAAPISAGESAQLRPIFANGNGVVAPVLGIVESNSIYNVTPAATTTYQLTVTNAAGFQAFAQRTITVLSGPFATSFIAAPAVVSVGGTSNLTAIFSGTGATGSVDNGIGAVLSGVPAPTAALGATTTFTLTVTNGAGTIVTRTATVVVVPLPVATSLVATPATINAGQASVLVPTFSDGTGVITAIGNVVNGGSYNVTLFVTTTYTLVVTNAAGAIDTFTATVTVLALPFSSSFTVSPAIVSVGDSIFMNWVYNLDATGTATVLQTDDGGVVTTIYGPFGPAGSPGTGTSVPVSLVVPPYGLYGFTLRLVQGTSTVDTTRTVMVWELPTATITEAGALPSPLSIAAGTPVTLTMTFTGNTTARVLEEVTGTTWTVSNGDSLTINAAPVAGQQRRVRLTVQNPAGTVANTVYIINSI
ncbi:MAG: hypothetical protein IPQ13_00155 [Holophagaceae bacterium]|nr:hypothetical protein [Holophagaceae bacterium]